MAGIKILRIVSLQRKGGFVIPIAKATDFDGQFGVSFYCP
jgi:hypothetical protein